MTESSNTLADVTLDFDNAEKAKERRKRRSSIFEKCRSLANISCLDVTHEMAEVDSDKYWEKSYMEEMRKEINDWKNTTQSLKNQMDCLSQKLKNRESLNNLVPSQLLSMKEKKFLRGSEVYKMYAEKIDYTQERFALAEKLHHITDNSILMSVDILVDRFNYSLKNMWLVFGNNYDNLYEISVTPEHMNMENLPYAEPFLQDFSNV